MQSEWQLRKPELFARKREGFCLVIN
jgi:hypothetical protein